MGILKLRKWAVAFFIAGLGASGCGEPPPPGMVLVPAGYFSMGSDEEDTGGHALSLGLDKPWYADETPQRRLHLDDFFIDRYEVTNKEYYIFTQATDRKPPRTWKGPRYPEGEDQFPVHGVSFYDAAYFILKREGAENTGNFYIDSEVLKEEGIDDLSKYSEGPQSELMRDFFLD